MSVMIVFSGGASYGAFLGHQSIEAGWKFQNSHKALAVQMGCFYMTLFLNQEVMPRKMA
jgi:hypothetical protein